MTRTNKTMVGVLVAALATALAMPAFAAPTSRNSGSTMQSSSQTPKISAQKKAEAKAKAKAAAKAKAKAAAKAAREKAAARGKVKKPAAGDNLAKNVENKLRARKARFDAAGANIEKRIARIAALAKRVEAAGGDVSAVEAKLDESRSLLAQALTSESSTAEQFSALPGAQSKRSAFAAARATGRESVAALTKARVALRDAARLLREVVIELRESES